MRNSRCLAAFQSTMAAARNLRVSVKPDSGSDSDSDRDAREAEPMEVEEGELEVEDISVNCSLKELLPDTSRRYENKAGAFITGIDVNSKVQHKVIKKASSILGYPLSMREDGDRTILVKEAIEKKEKRARRFHFQVEERVKGQRTVYLDKDMLKKAIPRLRLEAIHITGVDDMSTQDVFGYFKEYPPAHIEWIDDTSCNVVWLDEDTCVRALVNTSRMPETPAAEPASHQPGEHGKVLRGEESDDDDDEEEEEGEVEEDEPAMKKSSEEAEPQAEVSQVEDMSRAERASIMRNDLRPAINPFKGNKLLLRFATQEDRKEPGAARRSRYYMKYGNPNYGGMKGILSNSWKRRYHNRRIQRDVIKSKKPLIGDSMGHTPPYTHRHSADLVNLPEEPIKEEEEEEEEAGDEDMDSDDRVVEFKERGARSPGRAERASSPWSESDEMDYDLELKMISTPSPKKSKKMTMYADELDGHLKNISRNRIGTSASHGRSKSSSPPKVTDVRQFLEEKRQGAARQQQRPAVASSGKTDVRQRLGKRQHSASPMHPREPTATKSLISDVHRRLGAVKPDRSSHTKDRKPGGLWSRLGGSDGDNAERRASAGLFSSTSGQKDAGNQGDEEKDSTLQRVWGAMIKQKQELVTHKLKKSRLDNLPSLQIEISRDSTDDSDA